LSSRELLGGFTIFHLVLYGIRYSVVLPLTISTRATKVTVKLNASRKRVRVSISYELPFAVRIRIP